MGSWLSSGAPGADDPAWNYYIMPFISGLVGWGTNVVALKMTFYPIEFQPAAFKVTTGLYGGVGGM